MLRWLRRRQVTRRVQCGPVAKWGQPGDRVTDGGIPGVLVRCHECGGTGLLHKPDEEALAAMTAGKTESERPERAQKTNRPPW